MKTLLVAASSAAALNTVALADVLANSQNPKTLPTIAAPALHAVTGNQPTGASLEKAIAPSSQTSKWTWIPSQRTNDGAPQTQIVAIPVPAPGAAALIGLSGLIFSRRRNGA